MRAGAKDAVTFVASEQVDALVTAARGGKAVFLDATFLTGQSDAAAVNRLRERFSLTQRARNLYELQPL
jgi:uracil phosphoribosyltransferase